MRGLNHISIIFVIVVSAGCEARGQTEQKARATGSISGSVTILGKPASGVKVVTLQGDRSQHKTVAAARTDADGHYQLRDIPAGNCIVAVDAPAFAADLDGETSKTIKLENEESVQGINLEIAPGAVITGRVTETSGRPVIGQTVQIVPFKDGRDDDDVRYALNDVLRAYTDDRGVYRAYGLPAGRYRIKVGDGLTGRSSLSLGRVPLPETYHPAVTDRSKAEVVEVAAASEATDIDIRVNLSPSPKTKTKTYAVNGRIVDAQLGRPLPRVGFHYQSEIPYKRDRSGITGDLISEFGDTDSKGYFRINELASGKYTIAITTSAESPWFAEEAEFEVVDSDIRGLELTVRPAGSISGVVMLDNSSDAALVARISQLKLGDGHLSYSGVPINKDGSFRLAGLKPGVHPISFSWGGNSEGFEILRVERDGVQLDKTEQMLRGIKVGPCENVTGVRVIIAHYTGGVSGQIKIEGGALPSGGHLEVSATPTNQPKKDTSWTSSKRFAVSMSRWRRGTIDARGRFVINRLPPGEYEINLDAYLTPWKYDDKNDKDEGPITVTRVVTVSDAGEAQVDLVLDLSKTQPRKQP